LKKFRLFSSPTTAFLKNPSAYLAAKIARNFTLYGHAYSTPQLDKSLGTITTHSKIKGKSYTILRKKFKGLL